MPAVPYNHVLEDWVRPELKVLFMSGYAPGSLRQMQQELPNAIDLVNKPFTRNDLTEKVRAALAA